MKTLSLAGALMVAVTCAHAQPVDAPSPRELHAAQCVAALQVDTERLAAEVKAGKTESRPLLQARLEAGVAFVGEAYLQGTRDEAKARALANNALEAQKSLSKEELAARQTSCADEGTKLLDESNGLERAVVKQVAKRRMAKLLAG
jgi:hypothetical protein